MQINFHAVDVNKYRYKQTPIGLFFEVIGHVYAVQCKVLISDNHINMQRMPDDSSIFTAEAKAVGLALDFIKTCDTNNKFIIFSASLSVLKAMTKPVERFHRFRNF